MSTHSQQVGTHQIHVLNVFRSPQEDKILSSPTWEYLHICQMVLFVMKILLSWDLQGQTKDSTLEWIQQGREPENSQDNSDNFLAYFPITNEKRM